MYLLTLICLFCASFVAGSETVCPDENIDPCVCTPIGYHTSTITCNHVENENDLQVASFFLRNTPIRAFEIISSAMNYLPSKVFQGLEIYKLNIFDSSFMSFSDTDTAFVGLEKTLQVLNIQETLVYNGWEWSQLRKLSMLKEIYVIKSGPLTVDTDMNQIAHLNLEKLTLQNNAISFVHPYAFISFKKLKVLSMKQNEITQLRRSMFPTPANELLQMIFSYNKLETIPRDMFTEMPKLQSVVLASNRILSIDKNTFAPVWNNLKMLNLDDNHLRCDCRMKWMLSVSFPRNTWAKCAEPQSLKGKPIQNLTNNDLWC
ncbi:peroxidasin-like [Stegodyphus dumicola]|uniref:peroxidasin-like n=1 Tax=Stegodyphus dumicola TaxID=202533 RepID=UPI0015A7ED0F|nr:peroxidasin-like [Stegodyphus dumicola]